MLDHSFLTVLKRSDKSAIENSLPKSQESFRINISTDNIPIIKIHA